MADMQPNQQPWENQWQKAFEGAETPPPDHVWKNIEGELAVQETGKYRRGFLLYRAVAAVLLLLIAGLSWYTFTQQPTKIENTVVDLESPPNSTEQPAEAASAALKNSSGADSASSAKPLAETESSTEPSSVVVDQSFSAGKRGNPPVSHELVQPPSTLSTAAGQRRTNAKPSVATVAQVAAGDVADVSPLLLPTQSETILYRVPQVPTTSEEKNRPSRSLFAGLSLAPGYFDPQFQANASDFGAVALSPSPGFAQDASYLASAENYRTPALPASIGVENTPELSFTYGFDVGMNLSDHWVLESGVDYNRFSTSTATRWVVADVASGQRYAFVATNANTLSTNLNQAPNTSTDLNNAYEFIAVPMKIGYRRSVSKFQFTVSSGVAANFFLRNAISASSAASELSTYRISASKDGSPFNSVYYSGLLSGGVNYNVLGHYYLSLTPTYAFALTPLTRVDSNLSSNPYSFGVNVGFQYQF